MVLRREDFHCPKCGDIDSVTINGDEVAERWLGGLTFRVYLDNEDVVRAELNDREQEKIEHFASIQPDEWLGFVIHVAQTQAEYLHCVKCGEPLDMTHLALREGV